MRSLLFSGTPGRTTRWTAWKFFRESSSLQVALPGGSGCRRRGVPAEWHEMHRAWPGRLAMKMGCIFVLNTSKFSDADPAGADAGCWPSSPTSIRARQTTVVYTSPPHATTVLPSWRGSRLTLQRDLLRAPVPDLADDQIVLRPAVDRVDDAEFFRHLAGLAELSDDLAGEADLVDLAVLHALGIVRVGAVQVLGRAARNADRLRRADAGDLRLERPLAVEHLDAVVARVRHIDVARGIAANPEDLVEL